MKQPQMRRGLRPGYSVTSERDRAQSLMLANGLRADPEALELGVIIVNNWVLDGLRQITLDHIKAEVDRLDLRARDARAVLVVQAIQRDPNPEDAAIVLDWVDLYDGDSVASRRQPRDPASWATMSADLDTAAAHLSALGQRDVLVRGAMRQATLFAIGARLAQVTGTSVTYTQNGAPWASDTPHVAVPPPAELRIPLKTGTELAVAIGMSTDLSTAVASYIQVANLAVGTLLVLTPAEGAHDQSIAGPGQAVAYAQALRSAIRAQLEVAPSDRVHLFLAGPGGLALLLGHRWNRVAPTVVYEDLGAGRGYTQAFTVDA